MRIKYRILALVFLVLLGSLTPTFSQKSNQISSTPKEEFLEFQESFFKALAQKAIFNYRVAIQNLEKCNELKPKDQAVLFELSKNYFLLNKFFEAEAFAKEALKITPDNYWVLTHLSKIYVVSGDIKKAIIIQEKLALENPREKEKLVYLYFQNNQLVKVNAMLAELEKNQQLSSGLVAFKKKFIKPIKLVKKTRSNNLDLLIKEFEIDKNFNSLHKILTLSAKSNINILQRYSKIGLELYPAQAIVYLMSARGLNYQKKFKEAIEMLNNGIDFVIDNVRLEADFYDEISKSYMGLGNKKEAIKNKNKALTLRKK